MHWSPTVAKVVTKRTGGWSSRNARSAATICRVLGALLVGAAAQQGVGGGIDQRARPAAASASTLRPPPPQALQGAQEGGDHLGVELRAGAASQLGQALAVAQRAAGRAARQDMAS